MRLPNAADFEKEIRRRWAAAALQGEKYTDVCSGDLHRFLGGYPNRGHHRMPDCCQVMYRLKGGRDTVRNSPAKGYGASLVIRYVLPR